MTFWLIKKCESTEVVVKKNTNNLSQGQRRSVLSAYLEYKPLKSLRYPYYPLEI